jgi:ankyrin repeat protein
MLIASREGEMDKVKTYLMECPGLVYAQYNYTPPIHFAVREGHLELVRVLLEQGALDPTYITYPFGDKLVTIAADRNFQDIKVLLEQYLDNPTLCKYKGDNGEILYERTSLEKEFEKAVDKGKNNKIKEILQERPSLVEDETFFWGEGILMMPAKDGDAKLVKLLLNYGARVPAISKWGRFYYFKHYEIASLLMENGMNPNHMTWHHVTLLHDMAQEGDIAKAELLLNHGAELNPIEEEYHSTPLGMAVRWGNKKMVEFLLERGADANKSGATWSTPLSWSQRKGQREIESILRSAGAQ